MAALLALAAALVYGAGDFAGGLAARRAPATLVVLRSQLLGGVMLAAAALIVGGDAPDRADLLWGASGGLAGGGALALLYRGLASGAMSVVAPTTGVVAAAVPVLVGFGLGERPSTLASAGMVLAVIAIALVSQAAPADEAGDGAGPASGRVVGLAVVAGVGFGLFFVALDRTDPATGLFPLLPARGAAAAAFVALALFTRIPLRLPVAARHLVVLAAAGDTVANALYLLAVRRGLLSVVAVLTSLYPASTLVLARVLLGERLRGVQVVGLVAAAVAVVLVSLG